MKKSLRISIPNPCHEDWSKMTPNEQGRFCNSCAKTVFDFTKKTVPEIQEILLDNRHKKVCGHFYKKQLDSITIEIPKHILYQQLSFSKLFLLALLITMGTTLMSCNSKNGKKQKINRVVLIDSLKTIKTEIDPKITVKNDSASCEIPIPSKLLKEDTEVVLDGMIVVGDIDEGYLKEETIEIDDILEVIEEEADEEIVFGMIGEIPPKFSNTEEGSIDDLKKSFSDSITKFILDKFNLETAINLDLASGNYKIWATFSIDKKGNVINPRVKGPHKILEQEVIKILENLPQLVPGQQRGKPVKVGYTIPISFEIE